MKGGYLGNFSIHSPLAGRDVDIRLNRSRICYFQSTRPLRGETKWGKSRRSNCLIFNPLAPCGARPTTAPGASAPRNFSIHSPLAGRDQSVLADIQAHMLFNPLAPCGARPAIFKQLFDLQLFSIHSPLAGRDKNGSARKLRRLRFQSTRPLRGETDASHPVGWAGGFSIHSPLAGRDNLWSVT